MSKKIAVSLVTLESLNHIVGDIECGIKVYNQGGVDFNEREEGLYWVRVPHKGDFKVVSVKFARDRQSLDGFSCSCTNNYSDPPLCRHVVAAVLAIQGGIIKSTLAIGKDYWFDYCVADEDTARAVGSGDLEVLATPRLVTLMEHAAYKILEDELEDGQTSVGTNINIDHTAASPVGISVEILAKIVSVKGRAVTFEIGAIDDGGEIAKATHTRVIVDGEKLLERAKKRFPVE